MKQETKCYCGHTTYCDCGPEEPKQETLEEVAERFVNNFTEDENKFAIEDFIAGAKWQQERSYSEEEIIDLLLARDIELNSFGGIDKAKEWFKQFKKI